MSDVLSFAASIKGKVSGHKPGLNYLYNGHIEQFMEHSTE